MDKRKKYQQIQDHFKRRMQAGEFPVGNYLPSEHEICQQFSATRTTVRKALDELRREGFIETEHGRGTRVIERRRSLGLLSVQGFSGSADFEVETAITRSSVIGEWDAEIPFPLSEMEQQSKSVHFQRVRSVSGTPIVIENTWYALDALDLLKVEDFVDGSFFRTLSQKFHIEVLGVEQEIRAQPATQEVADMLKIEVGEAILFISVRFKTSQQDLTLYGSWYCHTAHYPIGSASFL